MQAIISQLQSATSLACGGVGIAALFVAGVIALWYNKFSSGKSAGFLFWFAIISLVFVINPWYIRFIKSNFTDMKVDNVYMWIVPTAPVVLYAGVICTTSNVAKRRKIIFYLGLVAIVILAAMSSFTVKQVRFSKDVYGCPQKEEKVFDKIEEYMKAKGKKSLLIWGPEEIIKDSRVYYSNLRTLYGADLWVGNTESQICQPYKEWSYAAYIYMDAPATHIAEIAEAGYTSKCDIIVLDSHDFDKHEVEKPESLYDRFYLIYEDKNYLIYCRTTY